MSALYYFSIPIILSDAHIYIVHMYVLLLNVMVLFNSCSSYPLYPGSIVVGVCFAHGNFESKDSQLHLRPPGLARRTMISSAVEMCFGDEVFEPWAFKQ